MKIKELVELMKKKKLDSLLIAGGNPHLAEFVPKIWQYREYISEFNSSFGNVVLTNKGDLLIATDTRYELAVKEHAQKNNFAYVLKAGRDNFDEELDWISQLDYSVKNIGVIDETISLAQYSLIMDKAESIGIDIKFTSNLVEEVWDIEQPEIKQIFSIDKYDDTPVIEKLEQVRNILLDRHADFTVITNLETIAILTKTRGYDIPNTPSFISYLIVGADFAKLFVDLNKVPNGYLIDGIEFVDYKDFEEELTGLAVAKTVLIEPYETTYFVYKILEENAKEVRFDNQEVRALKGIKTAQQLANLKISATKDGVALAKLFYYIEKNISKDIREIDALNKLYELKTNLFDDFIMESFPTIAAYNKNGAMIHYHTGETILKPEGVLLVDSGSQYMTGTTDVTRTISLGNITGEMKEFYTRVLKGHLEIARLVFTEGIVGKSLDLLARKHLFEIGKDYKHGTGHGVGYISNVHETSGIGVTPIANHPIYVGMTFSNEPGYYLENKFGIRIENVVGVIPSKYDTNDTNSGENFAEFMQLTMYPYDLDLIDINLLTNAEKEYINKYHTEVFERVSVNLNEEEKSWFKTKCRTID